LLIKLARFCTFIREIGIGYYDREIERIGIAVANRMKALGWPSPV
jgi:hypothetical protein